MKIKLGILSSPRIVPFIGYSNGTFTFIGGEVLEDIGISKPIEGQSRWKNLKSMIKRYLADEFAGVKVQVIFKGQTQEVITNKYGVFNARFKHDAEEIEDVIWQKAYFRLNEIVHPKQIDDAKLKAR
ncbi:MAG: hypothetical protein HC905_10400 [Bacteroidales bacterium]|nr:hypothetical protein [Bacteroidales bacterium]